MTPPRIVTSDNWPLNHSEIIAWRAKHIQRMRSDPTFRTACMKHYANGAQGAVDWITDFCVTIDPRADVKVFPFILFQRQVELIEELYNCLVDKESIIVSKSRDMGCSWVCLAFLTWVWLFYPNTILLAASRKEMLVDRLGDSSTLFQKVRAIIEWLPQDLFWPEGNFSIRDHAPYMRIMNPANGSVIVGEAGIQVGRGGRYQMALVDEFAFLENQEAVDSALGDACPSRVYISTYNVSNDLFHRKVKSGVELPRKEPGKLRVFTMSWRSHFAKSQAWYDRRKAEAEAEGTLHLFAREIDLDPSAAQANVLIPGLWASAAVDAHIKLGFEPSGAKIAGVDVADGGGDSNAMVMRHGVVVQSVAVDGGESDKVGRQYYTRAMVQRYDQWRFEVSGVGAGARAGATQIASQNAGRPLPKIIPWSPTGAVVRPHADITTGMTGADAERRNRDHFQNANGQAWFQLRERFRKTYRAINEGITYDPDELISLPSTLPELNQLLSEISQPLFYESGAGKFMVEKQPKGSKSPNMADALKICFAELTHRPDEPACGVGGVGPSAPGTFISVSG